MAVVDAFIDDRGAGRLGRAELRRLVRAVTRGRGGGDAGVAGVLGWRRLASHVYRVSVAGGGGDPPRTVILKRLKPEEAWRSESAARRWLPAVGLEHLGRALLGSVEEPPDEVGDDGQVVVWHAYEDLAEPVLDESAAETDAVDAAVEAIAQLHTRFAEHPLLAECRARAGARDGGFYVAQVRDATRALESLRPPRVAVTADVAALRDRLLRWMDRLRAEGPDRLRAFAEWGGPETLLHGDLWPKNVVVQRAPGGGGGGGLRARLIDWDRAAVGPASYDLSTFLSRLPVGRRPDIMERYRQRVARCGWQLPPPRPLNDLLETAEWARLANCVVWPALELWRGRAAAEWAWDQLALVEQWFAAAPVPLLTTGA